MFCYFPENDQCNWEVDQGPEHQRYVFPRGLGLLGRNSCPCLSVWQVWSRSQNIASNLRLFVPEQVLRGESSWVCITINNKGLSAMVTDGKDLGGYIFSCCWENGSKFVIIIFQWWWMEEFKRMQVSKFSDSVFNMLNVHYKEIHVLCKNCSIRLFCTVTLN